MFSLSLIKRRNKTDPVIFKHLLLVLLLSKDFPFPECLFWGKRYHSLPMKTLNNSSAYSRAHAHTQIQIHGALSKAK
jgi:hypothetical protein